MSSLVFGRDKDVAEWVSARMPRTMRFTDCAAIGIARDGKLIAGAVYSHFNQMPHGNDIQISFAADDPRWATKGHIAALLRYPFVQIGCVRVTTIIGRKNKRARKFNEGIGFRLEGVCAHAYDGRQDACVYGMTKRQAAKWLEGGKNVDSRQAA